MEVAQLKSWALANVGFDASYHHEQEITDLDLGCTCSVTRKAVKCVLAEMEAWKVPLIVIPLCSTQIVML